MTTPASRISRKTLLATVSAVALTLAWGSEARAADIFYPAVETIGQAPPADSGPYVWLSLEGRYNMFDSNIFNEEGDSTYGDPDAGWSGGLELGVRPAGSPWDYVGRLIYGQADGQESFSSPYVEFSSTVEEESVIADFEVGRHIGVGLLGGDTRVHAGLRYVHFDADLDADITYPIGLGFENQQKVNAVGPRIGIDQTIPLVPNLEIKLSAAGAALFGRRDYDTTFLGYIESEDDITVWNAEASAGLTHDFGRGSVTLGYRIDAFWALYRNQIDDFDELVENDRITHGPFAKLTVDLAGGN